MTALYLIGRIIRILDNTLELEVLISPVHKPAETVRVMLSETLRHRLSEGSVIAVKARPRRRLIFYDLTNLDASEIIQLSGTSTEELIEKARVIGQALTELDFRPAPPLI